MIDLTRYLIPIPAPPMLEEALGIHTRAQWIACWWQGADLSWFDNCGTCGCGAGDGGPGWWGFIQHPAVRPLLVGFFLGTEEKEATAWLLIDRATRRLYVLPGRKAERFLHEVAEEHRIREGDLPWNLRDLSMEERAESFEGLQDALGKGRAETGAEGAGQGGILDEAQGKKQRAVDRMTHWLDGAVVSG